MRIFIADYLPLANKGEEEILRGIGTLFKKRGDEKISFSVFGDVTNVTQLGNVTVYPKIICYPDKEYKGRTKYIVCLIWAFLDLLGIFPHTHMLTNLTPDLRKCDKILIGHDGFFNIRCAMLGNYLHRKGLRYGILGAGFNKPGRQLAWMYNKVYKKCFDNAQYIILREQTAYSYVKSISNNPIISLFPDPAFFCPSSEFNAKRVTTLQHKYGFNSEGLLKIGMTVCEDSISFSRAFVKSSNKIESHRVFMAELMKLISDRFNCIFYFLPHCIKEGKGNDITIAKDIKARLDGSVSCEIIEEDLPVLDIKHIISKMDFMIGERTHSIINSIATCTPFVSVTCSADFRTHDIVGKGCGLPQQIYNMDYPEISVLFDIVRKSIEDGEKLKEQLQCISVEHKSLKVKLQEII